MAGISRMPAMKVGHQNKKIRYQVRQRMKAIGNQALGIGDQADAYLNQCKRQVHGNADPGDLPGFLIASGVDRQGG
jgi:hypothetical protein